MNKKSWIIGIMLWPALLYGQHSKDNYNQWASMEFKQWSFTPKSYYYSWYTKKVLGISIKVPGEGVHDNGPGGIGLLGDNYVNQRWRQMSGLRATAVFYHTIESRSAKEENKTWNDVMEKDLLTIADREVDAAYSLTGKKRDDVIDKVEESMLRMDSVTAASYLMEYQRISMNISYIKNSNMDNARKLAAYQKENKALEELQMKMRYANTWILCDSIINLKN